jgi:Fibronectin type III domain
MLHVLRRSACVTIIVASVLLIPEVSAAADTSPPTTPTNVRVGDVTPTTVQLRFDPSSDDMQVNGYIVRGGPQEEFAGDGHAFVQLLEPGTSYSFTVIAFDAAGNRSAPSSPVTVTTPAWQPPRNVRITSQSGGTVALAWEDPANMPDAARFLVDVDGRLETISPSPGVTVRHVQPGAHRLTVRASNLDGAISPPSAPVTVTVAAGADRTPPTVPTGLRSVFDPDDCLYDVSWNAASDDVDPASGLSYDLQIRDWLTGERYVFRYDVAGTSLARFPIEVTGIRAVDRSGNASAFGVPG